MRIRNSLLGAGLRAFLCKPVQVGLSALLCFAIQTAVWAASETVVATGDSLTCLYWSSLPQAFNNVGMTAAVPDPNVADPGSISTACGGLNSSGFIGQTVSVGTSPINYVANVKAADPDVILYMLGINDLGWDSNVDARFTAYKANIGPAFDELASFTNSQGQHPKVVIGSILPFDVAKNEAYWTQYYGMPFVRQFDVLSTIGSWDAWLKQEANQHGFTYLDNFSLIQQVPDWQDTLLGVDGLPLFRCGRTMGCTKICSGGRSGNAARCTRNHGYNGK